jgi:hypothetical protein
MPVNKIGDYLKLFLSNNIRKFGENMTKEEGSISVGGKTGNYKRI